MRLDAVDGDDQIRLGEGMAIEEDGDTGSSLAESDGFHARADVAVHRVRGDAVGSENIKLPLGSGTTVAAHRRDDEHRGVCLAHPLDAAASQDRRDRQVDVVDPVVVADERADR